jgi:hypothetical protein
MPDSKTFILFITGISGSGKTYLFEKLKDNRKFNELIFHDIDEVGVPEVGRTHWRPYRIEEMLNSALNEYANGRSSVLCGISKPDEILDFKYVKPTHTIHFLLLDIPMDTFRIRMKERLKDSTEDIDFTELEMVTKRLKQKLLNQVSALKNGHIIDTKKLTKKEMIQEAEKILVKLAQ